MVPPPPAPPAPPHSATASTISTTTVSTPRITNNHHHHSRRPPKPAGIPWSAASPVTSASSTDANNVVLSSTTATTTIDPRTQLLMLDNSERSRSSLRGAVQQRRSSLTRSEQDFLMELTERGNEEQVQTAYETLLDEDLFFVVATPAQTEQLLLEENSSCSTASGWRGDFIQMGKERDESTRSCPDPYLFPTTTSIPHLLDESMTSSRSLTTAAAASSNNLGSERRQQALQERRHSLLHGKMWQAHETGLAVSSQASHRSVRARQQFQQLPRSQQQQTIFRRARDDRRYSRQNNNNNNNREAQPSQLGFVGRRASVSSLGRPVLNRMPSEGSRKSVTFAIPKPTRFGVPLDRRNSVGSVPSGDYYGYERSNSIGSIPSIHHGHPITSGMYERRNSVESWGNNSNNGNINYSRRDSMESIPSIHHGHLVLTGPDERGRPYERSQSIGSLPSIPHGHTVPSPRSSSCLSASTAPILQRAHSVHSSTTLRDDSQHSDLTASEAAVVESDFLGYFGDEKKNDPPLRVVDLDTTTKMDPTKDPHPGHPFLVESTKLLHMNDPDAPHQLLLLDNNSNNLSIDADPGLSQSASSEIPPPPQRPGRPVIVREASSNNYKGEGLEVEDWLTERQASFDQMLVLDPAPSIGESLMTFGDGLSIKTSNSFDERWSYNRVGSIFRRAMNRRRSMSDEEPYAGIILGGHRLLINKESSSIKDLVPTDDDSWRLGDEEDDFYDSWKVIEDEYVNGYGGGGTLPFGILGTAADDVDSHPHVLSPPLMESLQAFLPTSQSGSNFWMKYSLVRDGASMHTFLQHARGAKYSVLAIETLEGEVFGAFTAEPWRKNWNYFGSGESFLWKMRQSRRNKCHSLIDQAQMESEIDVYPFTGENHCIQLCTHDKIAVGGGAYESPPSVHPRERPTSAEESYQRPVPSLLNEDKKQSSPMIPDHAWGFGIALEGDLLHGTSSPCLTFASPSLANEHARGEVFEIMNLELWTLTPCDRLEDAEKLELGKLFLEKHTIKRP